MISIINFSTFFSCIHCKTIYSFVKESFYPQKLKSHGKHKGVNNYKRLIMSGSMFWLKRKETARRDLAKSKHYRELPRGPESKKEHAHVSNLHGVAL